MTATDWNLILNAATVVGMVLGAIWMRVRLKKADRILDMAERHGQLNEQLLRRHANRPRNPGSTG